MKILRKPTHPGIFFKRDILETRGISVTTAARTLGISRKSLSAFINGHSMCSHAMARRLAEATGTSVAFWITMQAKLDVWIAENMVLGNEISPLPEGNVSSV